MNIDQLADQLDNAWPSWPALEEGMRGSRIRTRILWVMVSTVVVGIGLLAVLAAQQAKSAVMEGLHRDMERTAGLVARSGFLSSPNILEQVARFLEAEVVSLDAQGGVLASSWPRDRAERLSLLLSKRQLLGEARTQVVELVFEGQPWTVGVTSTESGLGPARLALIYPGRLVTTRMQEALGPLILSALLVSALATLGAVLLGRSVVRPIETLAARARSLGEGGDLRLPAGAGADEVQTLAQTLSAMVEALSDRERRLAQAEKLAALGRLSGAMAHELRNPLSSIRLILELERDRAASREDERGRRGLDVALTEIERLSLSTTKLLTFVRGPSLEPKARKLSEVAEDVLTLLQRQLEHLGVRVERSWEAGGDPCARVDAEAFRHVVLNLVQNAAQAVGEGGLVSLATREEEGCVVFEVGDEGPGIPAEDGEAVFEPFYSKREGGTGLGLAITKAIVEAHEGSLRHRPREPRGVVFEVRLPLAEVAAPLTGRSP